MKFDAVLIAGPTASGKSAAALALAEEIGGVVINADSMQVYREAPILTAQPGAADKARVPHLLYGHVSAREVYSVGRYGATMRRRRWRRRARWDGMPIFVGGTGLYFMALTDGLARDPAHAAGDPRRGARAAGGHRRGSVARAADRRAIRMTASRLRPSDPQRVLRAYEVFEATGRPLVEWQNASRPTPVLEGHETRRLCAGPAAPGTARPHRRAVRGHAGPGRAGRGAQLWTVWIRPCRPPNCWACARFRLWPQGDFDPGRGAGRRHHRHAAICQAPDDVVSPPYATLYLV